MKTYIYQIKITLIIIKNFYLYRKVYLYTKCIRKKNLQRKLDNKLKQQSIDY